MSYIADDGVKWFKIEYPTFYGRNTAPIKRRKKYREQTLMIVRI
jgi:hypothetical protein